MTEETGQEPETTEAPASTEEATPEVPENERPEDSARAVLAALTAEAEDGQEDTATAEMEDTKDAVAASPDGEEPATDEDATAQTGTPESEANKAEGPQNGLSQLVQQYAPLYQAQGLTPEQAIAYMFQAQQSLITGTPEQRAAALRALGEQHGIREAGDASQGKDPDEYQDPEIVALNQKISQLEQAQTWQQQQAALAERQNANNAVEAFRTETLENGELKRPHFDAVRQEMGKLYTVTGDLEQAYNLACMSDPEIAGKVRAEQEAAWKASVEADRKEHAQKAAKASETNTSSATQSTKVVKSDGTPEGDVRAAMAELGMARL